jgi:uncharacterized membrane protein YgcG
VQTVFKRNLHRYDMAGFAVRLSYVAAREARFRHSLRPGYLEDNFLRDVTGRVRVGYHCSLTLFCIRQNTVQLTTASIIVHVTNRVTPGSGVTTLPTGDRETDPYADVEPLGDGATRVLAWHLSWKVYPDTAQGEEGFRPKDWHVVHTLRQPALTTCPSAATPNKTEVAAVGGGGNGDSGNSGGSVVGGGGDKGVGDAAYEEALRVLSRTTDPYVS